MAQVISVKRLTNPRPDHPARVIKEVAMVEPPSGLLYVTCPFCHKFRAGGAVASSHGPYSEFVCFQCQWKGDTDA